MESPKKNVVRGVIFSLAALAIPFYPDNGFWKYATTAVCALYAFIFLRAYFRQRRIQEDQDDAA